MEDWKGVSQDLTEFEGFWKRKKEKKKKGKKKKKLYKSWFGEFNLERLKEVKDFGVMPEANQTKKGPTAIRETAIENVEQMVRWFKENKKEDISGMRKLQEN